MTSIFKAPRTLSGSPFTRGVAQASDPDITVSLIHNATVAQVELARKAGIFTPAARQYLKDQEEYSRTYVPLCIDEVQGIARGFNLDFNDLFTYLHLGTLRDLHNSAPTNQEGCSAWATLNSPSGPVLTKNRDFTGAHLDVQRLTRCEGEDLQAGVLSCLGSLGAPGAYSSGMNAAGLAIADTQIGISRHGVGLLRYFLMTEVLRQCSTVDQAIDLVNNHRHAGGGSLILADSDSVAAIELGTDNSVIEKGITVFRTNHFISPPLTSTTLHRHGHSIDENSTKRFEYLKDRLQQPSWTVADIQTLMATHELNGQSAPLCQHPDKSGSQTLSSIIYECATASIHYHPGNPCLNQWHYLNLIPSNR